MQQGTVMDAYYKEVIGIIDDIHTHEKRAHSSGRARHCRPRGKDRLVYVFDSAATPILRQWRFSSGRAA